MTTKKEDFYKLGTELKLRTNSGLHYAGPLLRVYGDFLIINDIRSQQEVAVNIHYIERIEVKK